MTLNITSGRVLRAQKVVIYGPEGIGKTTLAASFPDPLFIDTEGGSSHLDVRRIERPAMWTTLIDNIEEVAQTDGICHTLVIDTADWAEQMAITYICAKYNQKSIEGFGYGKGYTYIGEEFARFLSACNKVIDSGKHVVITAHAKMRKFEQPDEMGAYDRWEMKLTRQTAPLLKEWSDHLFFCNYETTVIHTDNGGAKATGGKRVIHTDHHPAWDAKTRSCLPPKVDMSFSSIASAFEMRTPLEQIADLSERDGIGSDEILAYLKDKAGGKLDGTASLTDIANSTLTWVITNWNKVIKEIKED